MDGIGRACGTHGEDICRRGFGGKKTKT